MHGPTVKLAHCVVQKVELSAVVETFCTSVMAMSHKPLLSARIVVSVSEELNLFYVTFLL